MKALRLSLPIITLLIIPMLICGQTVAFSYDNAGNRLSRTLDTIGGELKSMVRNDTIEIKEEIVEDEKVVEEMIDGETRIFPNPTHGIISIDFHPEGERPYYVSINNLSGYLLIKQRIFEGKK